MAKKFEDVFVGGGDFKEAKFRGALLKYARFLNCDNTDGEGRKIKVRNVDKLADTILTNFENWINGKLDDSWYKKREDYVDRQELVEILNDFTATNAEFHKKVLSNSQHISNTGGVVTDNLYENRGEYLSNGQDESGESDTDSSNDIRDSNSSGDSTNDVVSEFVDGDELDTDRVYHWMDEWVDEHQEREDFKTGDLLAGYNEGWLKTLSRKAFDWINGNFDASLWDEVFKQNDSWSFQELFVDRCREDTEFKKHLIGGCVEITEDSHKKMALEYDEEDADDDNNTDEEQTQDGEEEDEQGAEDSEEEDGKELGEDKDDNVGYMTMREKGLLVEGNGKLNTNWTKIRGTVVLFAKQVDKIEGTEMGFNIDDVEDAYFKWMMDKIGREWMDYTMRIADRGDIQEQVEKVYNTHDEANKLMHDKYEYSPDESSGNTSKRESTNTTSEQTDDGAGDSSDRSITDRKKKLREIERKNSGESESGSSSSSSTQSGALGKFAEEYGTTESIERKESNSGGKLTEYENEEQQEERPEGSGESCDGDSQGSEDEDNPEDSGENETRSDGDTTGTDGEGGLEQFAQEYGTIDEVRDGRQTTDAKGKQETVTGGEDSQAEIEDSEPEGESEGSEGSGEDKGDGSEDEGEDGLARFAQEHGTTEEMDRKERPAPRNKIIHGNSEKELRKLKKGFVDTCITSPPYWQLRDYEGDIEDEWDDGEWNGQLGHEPTPQMFAEHIADIMDGVKRVLKPGGSLWMNMGDTYGGKSGGHYDDDDYDGESLGHDGNRVSLDASAVKEKSLAMVPQLCALELKRRGWILRNKIVWAKQVVYEDDSAEGITQPTAAKDRVVEKSAEMIYHFVKQKDYYYDLDPIRRPHKTEPGEGSHYSEDAKMRQTENHGEASHDMSRDFDDEDFYSEGGANLPRVWQVNLVQSSDEHYAAYPDKLVERPIKATCPEDGLVLDPFTGTGTTLKVAAELGRDYLGVEFSDKYIDIARKNVPDTKQKGLNQFDTDEDDDDDDEVEEQDGKQIAEIQAFD